jgi:hypothetical protein
MQTISTISISPDGRAWLENSRKPRVLHVFEHACNLINERREVLSVVTSQIGEGPFNLVIEDSVLFSDHLNVQSPISIRADQLNLGDLTVGMADAELWSARPDWEKLHARKDVILGQLMPNRIADYQAIGLDTRFATNAHRYSTTANLQALISNLSAALAMANIPSALTLTSQLAGLGIGLTPAGDDVILGALYAGWLMHPCEVALVIAQKISEAASPLTTSLSAAWLRSAGKGEAGVLWHRLFRALIAADHARVEESLGEIRAVGETSGADALAGFLSVLSLNRELRISKAR